MERSLDAAALSPDETIRAEPYIDFVFFFVSNLSIVFPSLSHPVVGAKVLPDFMVDVMPFKPLTIGMIPANMMSLVVQRALL